jgi:hypothetical protein
VSDLKPLPCAYAVLGENTSPRFAKAFAKGCRGRLTTKNELQPGPVALFGSPARWAVLQDAIAQGRTWYYGDHGFFVRGDQYRITKNNYQHSGVGDVNPTRWRALGRTIAPWRKTGRTVLLCPQTPAYHALFGMDRDQWVADLTATLEQHTDRPIIVRGKTDPTSIEEALLDAWAVVSFSSAVAIDALLMGVPNFTLAPWATAYPMGCPDVTQIERPVYPENRDRFCAVLANNQWTLHEIGRGSAWRAL